MFRLAAIILVVCFSVLGMAGQSQHVVVADSATHQALPSASVFDRKGNILGMSNVRGRLPYIAPSAYPVTIRYLGFQEKTIEAARNDTIFMRELTSELPEFVVSSKQHKVLHVLAYMREYSTLNTYTDTIYMFREKLVDFMLVPDIKARFKAWETPRVLKSNSYYHFTNNLGLDSVSNKCRHHFSWSDWISIIPSPEMPQALKDSENATDTVHGLYSPTEVWVRNGNKVMVDVDVLADYKGRKWVPNLSGFFKKDLDYGNFRMKLAYDNVVGSRIDLTDITGYSFNIESNGRGHDMFMYHKVDEPFFVSTYAEVYILDKEFIKVKEARKWERKEFDTKELAIIEPAEAPELQESVKHLVARVNAINHDEVRLDFVPDKRLGGRKVRRQNIGQRALGMLKALVGLSDYETNRKQKENWRKFRKEQIKRNNAHPFEE